MFSMFENPFATPTRREISRWGNRNKFSKYLPYMAYDDKKGIYYNQDDTAGFCFLCQPFLSSNSKTEKELAGLLELLPKDAVMSVSLIAFPYIRPYTEAYRQLKVRTAENPLLKETIDRFVDFLEQGRQGLPHTLGTPVRDFLLIISVKQPVRKDQSFNELKLSFKETLKGCYLFPEELPPITLIKVLSTIFNGYWEDNLRWDTSIPINEQIILADTQISNHFDHLRIGDAFFECVTPKQIPPEIDCDKIGRIMGGTRGPADDSNQIPCPFLYTLVIVRDDSLANAIRTKASLFKRQAGGTDSAKSILGRIIGEYALEYLETVNELEKGARMLYSMPILWAWDRDRQRKREIAEKIKRLFASQGFVPQQDKGILVPLLISALPFGFYNYKDNMTKLERYFIADQKQTAKLMPVTADYRGGGQPHLLMISRKGQIVALDPFDKKARNKNMCVMGTTGGGKSFTLNQFVLSLYASGAVFRMFDLGYSYFKLAKLLDAYYLDPGKGEVRINPFSNVPDKDEQETTFYLNSISALTGIMAYSETDHYPSETEVNLLKGATHYAWKEKGQDAGMDDIYRYLAQFPEYTGEEIETLCPDKSRCVENLGSLAQNLAFNLTQWTSRGGFGRFFNGKSNVDLVSHPFIVIELENLKRVPALFKVISLAVMDATTAVLYLLPREIRKVLVFEECGVTLKGNDLFGAVVEEAYRRVRKSNGSAVTVFQSPLDLQDLGSVGRVIQGNSEFQLFFPSPDYHQAIRDKILPLQGYESIMESIRSALPRYSEMMIKTPYGAGIVRPIVDSFTYWMSTSNPEDWALIQKKTREHGDIIKTIEILAEKRDEDLQRMFSAHS